jgi:hypothetical protein
MQHELATRGTGIGGDDRDLDAELVGGTGLAFANTLDLRGVEGIELPVALALALRAARESGLSKAALTASWPAIAVNIPDQPTQPGAQEAHFSMVAVELLGLGIASRHHRRLLGDAQIGLPESHRMTGQTIEPLDRCLQELRVGREGDVLGLSAGSRPAAGRACRPGASSSG